MIGPETVLPSRKVAGAQTACQRLLCQRHRRCPDAAPAQNGRDQSEDSATGGESPRGTEVYPRTG